MTNLLANQMNFDGEIHLPLAFGCFGAVYVNDSLSPPPDPIPNNDASFEL